MPLRVLRHPSALRPACFLGRCFAAQNIVTPARRLRYLVKIDVSLFFYSALRPFPLRLSPPRPETCAAWAAGGGGGGDNTRALKISATG